MGRGEGQGKDKVRGGRGAGMGGGCRARRGAQGGVGAVKGGGWVWGAKVRNPLRWFVLLSGIIFIYISGGPCRWPAFATVRGLKEEQGQGRWGQGKGRGTCAGWGKAGKGKVGGLGLS